jgi:hypothetical protein
MTPEQERELEWLAQAANEKAPGIWEAECARWREWIVRCDDGWVGDFGGTGEELSRFIAAAHPAVVLELLAELRRLREEEP